MKLWKRDGAYGQHWFLAIADHEHEDAYKKDPTLPREREYAWLREELYNGAYHPADYFQPNDQFFLAERRQDIGHATLPRPKTIDQGWILPNGIFVPCGYNSHQWVAETIAREAISKIEGAWVHVAAEGWRFSGKNLTKEQESRLLDLGRDPRHPLRRDTSVVYTDKAFERDQNRLNNLFTAASAPLPALPFDVVTERLCDLCRRTTITADTSIFPFPVAPLQTYEQREHIQRMDGSVFFRLKPSPEGPRGLEFRRAG